MGGGDIIQGDSAQWVRRPSGVTAWAAGQSLKSEELRQREREGGSGSLNILVPDF